MEAEETGDIDPYSLAARYHHQFVMIHPFGNGNGRISAHNPNFSFPNPSIAANNLTASASYANTTGISSIRNGSSFCINTLAIVGTPANISDLFTSTTSIDCAPALGAACIAAMVRTRPNETLGSGGCKTWPSRNKGADLPECASSFGFLRSNQAAGRAGQMGFGMFASDVGQNIARSPFYSGATPFRPWA
ncbi:hypothetical protein B0H63DRAFT_523378 [Podospora didyma]|uniref:Fido domain-containing protein n=1 Tax=Podospora didyma TaxID=330526 RepID=A0AAE0NQV8_9PEZI|nr:hypothetical protein B0H63DRAFT_523378 [Podospora didyma]